MYEVFRKYLRHFVSKTNQFIKDIHLLNYTQTMKYHALALMIKEIHAHYSCMWLSNMYTTVAAVENGKNFWLQILSIQGRIKKNSFLLFRPKGKFKCNLLSSSTTGS